jgi:hypothetical protein
MNDADSGTARGRRARGFDENERPTSPGQLPRTKTSRWRSVASAALQRGFGRLSDEEFDQGNEPEGAQSTSESSGDGSIDVDVDVEVSDLDPVAADAPTEPAVSHDAPVTKPSVPQPGRPTRYRGPNGTMRVRAREDLGPTGTMVIRRRPANWRPGRRGWVKVLGFAAACALVVVVGYRGDRSAGQEAAATPLAPSAAAPVAQSPIAPAVVPTVEPSDVAQLAPTVAAPVTSPPRRAAAHKGPRSKSTVF